MSDPAWLYEAIHVASKQWAKHDGDPATGEIIRAALPAIREGLAREIEMHPYADDGDGYGVGLRIAADIVRSEPCEHDSWAGTRCMGCGLVRVNA